MVADTHVELYLPSGKTVRFEKESQMFGGTVNSGKIFYTNIELEIQEECVKNGEKGITDFALYFKELRRREKEI